MGSWSVRGVLTQYGQAFRASLVHGDDPRLGAMWRFGLASVVFAVSALVVIVDGVTASGRLVTSILVAFLCLLIAIANGAYLVFVVRREGFADPDHPPPPE